MGGFGLCIDTQGHGLGLIGVRDYVHCATTMLTLWPTFYCIAKVFINLEMNSGTD